MEIIDFHVHLYDEEIYGTELPDYTKKCTEDQIVEQMKAGNVDTSVVINQAILPDIEVTRRQNDWFAEICENNDKLVGLGSVNAKTEEEALDEMERCVKDLDLRGFKFHPMGQGFDMTHPYFDKIMKKAAELDVPVLIDGSNVMDSAQLAKFMKLAVNNRKTKMCIAHAGGYEFVQFGAFWMLRSEAGIVNPGIDNVYFDISASCNLFYDSPFQEQFLWITKQLGSDNLLFGSDYPVNSQSEAVEAARNFGYPEEWVPKIFAENAKRLLKI